MRKLSIYLAASLVMAASPAFAFDLEANASKAAQLLNDHGVEMGLEKIKEAGTELVDLEGGKGLHVWSVGRDNKIIFDISGQTAPGDDLSGFILADGTDLMQSMFAQIDADGMALFEVSAEIPNPSTNELTPSTIVCKPFGDGNAAACAMAWE